MKSKLKDLLKAYILVFVIWLIVISIPGEKTVNPAILFFAPVLAFLITSIVQYFEKKKGNK